MSRRDRQRGSWGIYRRRQGVGDQRISLIRGASPAVAGGRARDLSCAARWEVGDELGGGDYQSAGVGGAIEREAWAVDQREGRLGAGQAVGRKAERAESFASGPNRVSVQVVRLCFFSFFTE